MMLYMEGILRIEWFSAVRVEIHISEPFVVEMMVQELLVTDQPDPQIFEETMASKVCLSTQETAEKLSLGETPNHSPQKLNLTMET